MNKLYSRNVLILNAQNCRTESSGKEPKFDKEINVKFIDEAE